MLDFFRKFRSTLKFFKRWFYYDRHFSQHSSIEKSVSIHFTSFVAASGTLSLGDHVAIGFHSIISVPVHSCLFIGKRTTIHSFALINGDISIGSDCLIGPRVTILSGDHIARTREPIRSQDDYYFSKHGSYPCHSVSIGDDCWLGVNSVVLPGVEFHAEAGCSINPNYCTDDGCPDFVTPLEILKKDE